jgi:hypothetical protein
LSDWKWLVGVISEPTSKRLKWHSVLARIILSVSFPIFFQLELISIGYLSSVNLGEYAVIQKLYASVTTALFSFVGLRILMERIDSLKSEGALIDTSVAFMSVIVFCVVLLVGFSLSFLEKSNWLSFNLILASAIVSALYTISSFLSLLTSTFKPHLAAKAFFSSLTLYVGAFYLFTPQTATDSLILSGLLFFSHIIFCYFYNLQDGR